MPKAHWLVGFSWISTVLPDWEDLPPYGLIFPSSTLRGFCVCWLESAVSNGEGRMGGMFEREVLHLSRQHWIFFLVSSFFTLGLTSLYEVAGCFMWFRFYFNWDNLAISSENICKWYFFIYKIIIRKA